MPQIKFSHVYIKFPPDFERSKLIEVLNLSLENMSEEFRRYDTAYSAPEEGGLKSYPLPTYGDYMVLLLMTYSGHLWTTIRRAEPKKEAWYRSQIGQVFDCVIVEGQR